MRKHKTKQRSAQPVVLDRRQLERLVVRGAYLPYWYYRLASAAPESPPAE